MSTSGWMKTLAFHPDAQGKSDRTSELSVELAVGVFRKVSAGSAGAK